MTCVSHFEIPNIGYVQNDTKIESVSRKQPMMNMGSQ